MSKLTDLISALRGLELPASTASLLGSISNEATALETDRDDLKGKVEIRQSENANLKNRAQTAESERDVLKAKVPEGAVILNLENAKEYEAFKALGKPAKDLKTDLERGATAEKTAHNATNREQLRKLGYEPTDRLLRDFEGVTVTVADSADKKSKVGKVKAGDQESEFASWAKAQGLDSDLERYRTTQQNGVLVLPQRQGDGTPSASATAQTAQSFQAARDAAANPLLGGTNKDGKTH